MHTCKLSVRASKETKSWFGASPMKEVLRAYTLYEAMEIDSPFVVEMIAIHGEDKIRSGVFVDIRPYERTSAYKIAFLLSHEFKKVK